MAGTATQKPPRYRTESVHSAPSGDQSKRPEQVPLQRTAARNIRRHWLRGVFRVAALVATDFVVLYALKSLLRPLHTILESSAPFAADMGSVFQEGLVDSWQFLGALFLSLAIAGAYGPGDRRRDSGRLFAASALVSGLSLYRLVWMQTFSMVLAQILLMASVVGVALVCARLVLDKVVRWFRPYVSARRVVVVYAEGQDCGDPFVASGQKGDVISFCVVGKVGCGAASCCDEVNPLFELDEVIEETRADTVFVCGPFSDRDFNFVVDTTLVGGCKLIAASRTATAAGVDPRPVWIDGHPFVELTAPSLKAWQLVLKRVLDVLGASLGLLILSPVLAGIAFWVRLDSPGPAVFRQIRLGARGKTFRCFKFRSMRADAEAVLHSDPDLYMQYVKNHFKLPDERDPRLTRAGRFLRRTSLDELPQLINVLRGDMSLVGPRPIVPNELKHYSQGAPLLLSLKPGMTGAWAVNGRSHVGYPDRVYMELEYVRRWSLWTDLSLLVKTIPAVLGGSGAH